MNRAEQFAARSAVFRARDVALKSAARVPDVPTLLVIVVAVAVLRAIGRGVIAVWSHREVDRIRAQWPMPDEAAPVSTSDPTTEKR